MAELLWIAAERGRHFIHVTRSTADRHEARSFTPLSDRDADLIADDYRKHRWTVTQLDPSQVAAALDSDS